MFLVNILKMIFIIADYGCLVLSSCQQHAQASRHNVFDLIKKENIRFIICEPERLVVNDLVHLHMQYDVIETSLVNTSQIHNYSPQLTII